MLQGKFLVLLFTACFVQPADLCKPLQGRGKQSFYLRSP